MRLEPFIPVNQPDLTRLRESLSRPLHAESLRDPSSTFSGSGLDLACGIILLTEGWTNSRELDILLEDFHDFLSVSMEIPDGKVRILCRKTRLPELPGNAVEKCRITVTAQMCLIETEDAAGLRRAFIHLEENMTAHRYPELAFGTTEDYTFEKMRISRSPLATYRFGGGWELNHEENFYPDAYLNALAHCHVNGIWVAGLFREMIPSAVLPELCTDVEPQALARLNSLTERAAKYGIGVYLFCMEPRAVKPDHPLFRKHPELRGTVCGEGESGVATLCFEQKTVQDYLREMLVKLWQAVPRLAGIIQIFAGERATSCRSIDSYIGSGELCPRCRSMSQADALSRIIRFQSEIIRETAPHARYLIWSYGLPESATKIKEQIYHNLGPEIVWLENYEHHLKKKIFGHDIINEEYSLSLSGPSPSFSAMWKLHTHDHPEIWPKLQLGTTYEFGNLPYLPVPAAAYRKNRKKYGGVFLSWIIGGTPGLMLKAFGMATGAKQETEEEFLLRLASFYYGTAFAGTALKAWKIFSEALELYPCDKNIFYYGPLPRSPGYLLHLDGEFKLPRFNYNWGIDRQRRLQAYYTTADGWSGAFTGEELGILFRRIAAHWKKGFELLKPLPGNRDTREQAAVAEAVMIITQSTANVYDFYRLRGQRQTSADLRRLMEIVRAEQDCASRMLELVKEHPGIGFQAELQYYNLSPALLHSKINNTEEVLNILKRLINETGGSHETELCNPVPADIR